MLYNLALSKNKNWYCWHTHKINKKVLSCVASYPILAILVVYGEWVNLAVVSAWHFVL